MATKAQSKMRIQPGQPAKNFTSQDILGHSVALPDYKGQRLMLSFYRYAADAVLLPLCRLPPVQFENAPSIFS